jgi:signal transduction histidine kinase
VLARLALTIFALAAVTLNLPQPARSNIEFTYIVAVAYLAFAIISTYVAMQGPPTALEQIVAHTIDIVCICLLIYLNHGPDSPFLVFFTFIVVSATLRWDWRGAVVTTALLALIFFLIMEVESHGFTERLSEFSLSQAILRPANLLVAGIMLGYVGVLQERSRMRLAKLVAWPGPDSGQDAAVPIASALGHAAEIMCVPRLLIIWEQPDEPFRDVVLWSNDHVQYMREHADRFGTIVVESVGDKSFSCHAKARGVSADKLIDEDLRRTFSIESALSAPFQLPVCHGRIFLLDPVDDCGPEDLLLAELIATRLGVDLEHHLLRSEREMAATLTERSRLARDLHDGVLQGLAAANIHLKLSQSRASGDIADHLTQIRQVLSTEQERIRAFVEATRSGGNTPAEPADLGGQIRNLLKVLSDQWGCDVDVTVEPPDLQTSEYIAYNVCHLLAEALSNAVRHGKASHVDVSVEAGPDCLKLRICDNGLGFPSPNNLHSDEELTAHCISPLSLSTRVKELGGSFYLQTSPSGVKIDIEIPL